MIHSINKFRIFTGLIFVLNCIIFLLLVLNIDNFTFNELDIAIYDSISEIRNPVLTIIFILISELGTWGAIFIAFSWGILTKKNHKTFLLSLVISLLGAQFLYFGLKDLINRPRPSFTHLIHYSGHSFPSGHSTISIVFYSIIVYFLYKNDSINKHALKTICVLVSAIVFLVGISRIYLGVHYFSDVAGGYITGFTWVIVLYALTTRKGV